MIVMTMIAAEKTGDAYSSERLEIMTITRIIVVIHGDKYSQGIQ